MPVDRRSLFERIRDAAPSRPTLAVALAGALLPIEFLTTMVLLDPNRDDYSGPNAAGITLSAMFFAVILPVVLVALFKLLKPPNSVPWRVLGGAGAWAVLLMIILVTQ